MMLGDLHVFGAKGIEVALDLRAGHIRRLDIESGSRRIAPLHTAPWIDDPSVAADETIPMNLRTLSGDFFCAPFGGNDLDGGPSHGAPANSPWRLIGEMPLDGGGRRARYELERSVMGARLFKELSLRDGHPFLYERHVFIGGKGSVPVANHAMTRFDAPGHLSFSKKLRGETMTTPQETDPARGRYVLAAGARFEDLAYVPRADGSVADLTSYPIGERHEDFVFLIEDRANPLGWAAAIRPAMHDIFLSLKNPAQYPTTMLWFSNGGRDYAPWNGRHVGVLGIEEGRTYAGYGHKASIAPNALSAEGVATALTLVTGGEAEVRNVIGGIAQPDGWEVVESIAAEDGALILRSGGTQVGVSYDDRFLFEGS